MQWKWIIVLIGGIVGMLLAVAVSSAVARLLRFRETESVELGRVGDQPVIQHRPKWWAHLLALASGLAGFAAGGWGTAYLVRLWGG
jgi:hypothetical protein